MTCLFELLLFTVVVQEVADNNCIYRHEIHHSAGEQTQVLEDVASDPTLPRTKSVRCSQCNHGEAVFFQVKSLPYLVTMAWLNCFFFFLLIPH